MTTFKYFNDDLFPNDLTDSQRDDFLTNTKDYIFVYNIKPVDWFLSKKGYMSGIMIKGIKDDCNFLLNNEIYFLDSNYKKTPVIYKDLPTYIINKNYANHDIEKITDKVYNSLSAEPESSDRELVNDEIEFDLDIDVEFDPSIINEADDNIKELSSIIKAVCDHYVKNPSMFKIKFNSMISDFRFYNKLCDVTENNKDKIKTIYRALNMYDHIFKKQKESEKFNKERFGDEYINPRNFAIKIVCDKFDVSADIFNKILGSRSGCRKRIIK